MTRLKREMTRQRLRISENKAVPVDEDPPEDRYARASHDDFAAEEHEWKQAYDEVMDLAVKKNPSLKEIIEQAKAREHVEWLQNHVAKQFNAKDRTEGYKYYKSVVKFRQKKT